MIFSRNKLAAPKPQKAKQSAGMLDDDEDITDIVSSFVPVDRPKPVAPPVAPMSAMKASGSTSPNNGPAVNTGPKAMFFGPGDDFDNSAPRTPQAPAARLDPSQDPAAKLAERQAANRAAQEQAAADAEARRRGNAAVQDRARRMAQNTAEENAQNRDLDGDGKIGGRVMTDDELIRQSIMELLSPIDRTAARAAAASGLDQRNAEATENMRARTGLAGMGLSGAAGAAVGAEGRKGEREKVLALDEFDRNARNEDLQRQLAAAGQYREQTAFEESLNALDTEPPSRREYPAGAEGDAAFQRDLKIWNDLGEQDTAAAGDIADTEADATKAARNEDIEQMSQEEFESLKGDDLEALGWTVEVANDGDGFYWIWTSPSGVKREAYSNAPWDIASNGLAW